MTRDTMLIDRLRCHAIIGIDAAERVQRQEVLISAWLSMDLRRPGRSDRIDDTLDYRALSLRIKAYVESSDRLVVEALATDVAGICLTHPRVESARVQIRKPQALADAESLGVIIERTATDLERGACIGLGSNRNPEANLAEAVRALARVGTPLSVSRVYQSAAIDLPGAANFLNAVCLVRTCLPAGEIRRLLASIEREAGRDASRSRVALDLDLLLLGDEQIAARDYTIPHPELLERSYLAMALADLDGDLKHPVTGESFSVIVSRLQNGPRPAVRPDLTLQTSLPPR
jgi:2-amino-4-hydroxy-6-hydroxymethyldihydropteridine diphosphokinase